IKQSQHSYLYTDPYEPIVHGTFGVDQSNWNIVVQIKDLYDEIMGGGSRGFRHPDYDG
ncbi:13433_t:CDS:1, partial [Gigaspora rosea]